MSNEMTSQERIDGSVVIEDKEKIKSITKLIVMDLQEEGFDKGEIYKYICNLVLEEIK